MTLPPGTYDVFIVPAVGANAAATDATLVVGAADYCAVEDVIRGGARDDQGAARIADGRTLVGATVSALPSGTLAGSYPRRWPRARTAPVASDGSFSLAVDPGVYDVLIEPAGGTGFPIVTAANQSFASGATVILAPMVVPAPIGLDVTLRDPGGNAIVDADVRAFAVPAGFVAPAPGEPAPSIEIGHFRTDPTGALRLLLAPPR